MLIALGWISFDTLDAFLGMKNINSGPLVEEKFREHMTSRGQVLLL